MYIFYIGVFITVYKYRVYMSGTGHFRVNAPLQAIAKLS